MVAKNKRTYLEQFSWLQQVRYAWQNVFNNAQKHWFATLLTLLVITISLTLPIVSYLLWKNSHHAIEKWHPSPNLTIYLNKTLDNEQLSQLQEILNNYPEIDRIDYLDREKTLDEFQKWSGFSQAISMLDDNPLPAVFILYPTDETLQSASARHTLQKKVSALTGIDEVKFDDGWFARLLALTKIIGKIAIVLTLLMVISVFLVIANSVRLNIFTRYDTIRIMQLIGATEGFVYRPFLYNGATMGFISALLAILFSNTVIWQFKDVIAQTASLFDTNYHLYGLNLEESLLFILIITIISWLSAYLATSRYLKLLTNK